MTPASFRFRPPAVAAPAGLRWVLRRAFGPAAPAGPPADRADDPLALAARLGLLPRLAARTDPERIAGELGGDAGERLRRERALAAARELAFAETLATVAAASAALGVAPILLKGRALVAAGFALPLSRPSQDLDLLVPADAVAALARALAARGFREVPGSGYEHHAPALADPRGVTVELHRHLPGVRLDGQRSADAGALVAAGLATGAGGPGVPSPLLLPARDVLVAHALVHALAQHGLSAAYTGWLLPGDLLDLGAAAAAGDAAPRWRAWVARDLDDAEIDAALALAAALAAGDDPFASPATGDATALARHFLATALDPAYAQALKSRWLERPLSEHGPLGARLRLIARAFVPPRAGAPESAARRAVRWLLRPFDLAGRQLRARRAARRQA